VKKRFQANVNGKHIFDLTNDDSLPFEKHTLPQIHAKDGNDSVNADFLSGNFLEKKYTIKINASFYEVSLQNELGLLIDEMGLSKKSNAVQNELLAPMPGLIVDILTKPGAKLSAGDGLIVLEAMKMENTLTASRDGIVKLINVKIKDTVDKGMLLIEFEKDEEN
jgi:acetyl/propionyl-CoA carboxylase alpha subunit